jgi:hypothetical protein
VASAGEIISDLRGAEGQPASGSTSRDKATYQAIERLAYSVGGESDRRAAGDSTEQRHTERVMVAPRFVLCLCDPEAAYHFTTARSWRAHALRAFAVEIAVTELPADVNAAVRAVQQRQYR